MIVFEKKCIPSHPKSNPIDQSHNQNPYFLQKPAYLNCELMRELLIAVLCCSMENVGCEIVVKLDEEYNRKWFE